MAMVRMIAANRASRNQVKPFLLVRPRWLIVVFCWTGAALLVSLLLWVFIVTSLWSVVVAAAKAELPPGWVAGPFRHPEAELLTHLRMRSPTRAGEPLALGF